MEHIGLGVRAAADKAEPVFSRLKVAWNTLMQGLSSGNFSGVGGNVARIFGAITTLANPMGNILVAVAGNVGAVSTQFGNLIAGALPLIAPLLQAAADTLNFLGQHTEILIPLIGTMVGLWAIYKAGVTAVNFAELFALPIKAGQIASNFALAAANRALADATALAAGEERASGLARLTTVPRLVLQTAATVAQTIAHGAAAAAIGVVTAAQWLWNAAMNANPIALVVIALVALIAGIVWAYNNIGWFRDGVNAAWKFISSVTMTVLGAVGAFFVGLWHGIVAVAVAVVTGLVSFFIGAWNNIGSFTRAVFGAIGAFFTGLWNGIVGFIVAVVRQMVSNFIGNWTNIFNVTRSVFSGIASFLGGVWGNIVNGVSGMIGNVLNFFGGLGGQIMGILSGAGGWLIGVGKDIINGLLSGIGSMVGAIGNAILGLVPGPIVGVFKAALGIASPSKVFRALGKHIPEGAIQGINDGKPDLATAVNGLVALPTAQSISASAAMLVPQMLSTPMSPAALAQSRSGGGITQNIYPQPGQSEELIGEYSMRQLSRAGLR
jgi:phage-related protein